MLRFFNSLIFRLLLILIVTFIPMLAVFFFMQGQFRKSVKLEHQRTAERLAQSAAAQHRTWIIESENIALSVSKAPVIKTRDSEAISQLFRDLKEINPSINNIIAVNTDGILFASGRTWEGEVSYADRSWFDDISKGAPISVSGVIIGKLTNEPLVAVAVPCFDEDGQLIAIISVGYNLNHLDHSISDLNLEQGDLYVMFNENGTIYHSTPELRSKDQQFPHHDELIKHAQSPNNSYIQLTNEQGDLIYLAQAKINSKHHTYHTFVGINTSQHQFASQSDWTQAFIVITLIGFTAFILALALAYLSVARPGKNLVKAARAMANGEALELSNSRLACYEMTDLSKSFQEMSNTIHGNIESLKTKNNELDQVNTKLNELVRIDPLTGACSRRHGLILLEEEIERFQRYKTPLSVLLMDIDKFKMINDMHGHSVGDQVLIHAVTYLNRMIRTNDHLIRYAGDEFIILLSGAGPEDAAIVCEKITAMPVQIKIDQLDIETTFSIGAVTLKNNQTAKEIIELADQTMYQAKQNGRNGFQMHAPPNLSKASQFSI